MGTEMGKEPGFVDPWASGLMRSTALSLFVILETAKLNESR